MQHFLVILLGLHLSIGLLLLRFGPLSALVREARGDARLSRLILALFILMLWPCLWPSAVYRPQFSMPLLTFEPVNQFDRDSVAPSSDALAS